MLPESLQTERLLSRAPSIADAEVLFHAYTQNARVSRYMMWRPHESIATTEAFIELCIADFAAQRRLPYVLSMLGAPDQAIGMLEARPAGHKVDLGYVLAPDFWGRGLMPEAVMGLTQAALATPAFFASRRSAISIT